MNVNFPERSVLLKRVSAGVMSEGELKRIDDFLSRLENFISSYRRVKFINAGIYGDSELQVFVQIRGDVNIEEEQIGSFADIVGECEMFSVETKADGIVVLKFVIACSFAKN